MGKAPARVAPITPKPANKSELIWQFQYLQMTLNDPTCDDALIRRHVEWAVVNALDTVRARRESAEIRAEYERGKPAREALLAKIRADYEGPAHAIEDQLPTR